MSQNDGNYEQRKNVDNAADQTCDRLAAGLCLTRVRRREGSARNLGNGFAAARAELATAAYRHATVGTDHGCFTPSAIEVLTNCRKHTLRLHTGQVIVTEPLVTSVISDPRLGLRCHVRRFPATQKPEVAISLAPFLITQL